MVRVLDFGKFRNPSFPEPSNGQLSLAGTETAALTLAPRPTTFPASGFCPASRGISSAGRALAWHARGHRFKSVILHFSDNENLRPKCHRFFRCAAVGQARPAPGDRQASPASEALCWRPCFGEPSFGEPGTEFPGCRAVRVPSASHEFTETQSSGQLSDFGVASRGRESAGGNRTPRPYRPWLRCPSTMAACDRTRSHLAFCFFRFASRR